MSRFDFVIFGASGFTGQFVVEYLARALKKETEQNPGKPTLTWAVSGRSEGKIKTVLENATRETGINVKDVPIIICDTGDDQSVTDMCRCGLRVKYHILHL